MRPVFRWFLFLLSLLVFTAALGWISVRMLEMEKQRQVADEEDSVQEKMRLALWRMDSLASALLIRENARPAYHYQAFYAPDDVFASKTRSIPKGEALMPSPLFGSLPDLVQLHFEKLPGQAVLSSPQAPAGSQRELATNWYTLTPQTAEASSRLHQLEALLQKHPGLQPPSLPSHASAMIGIKPAPLHETEAAKEKEAQQPEDLYQSLKTSSNAFFNKIEQNRRSVILDANIAQEKQEGQKPMLKKAVPSVSPKFKTQSKALSESAPIPADQTLDSVAGRYQKQEPSPAPAASQPVAQQAVSTPPQSLPATAGDLSPVWLDDQLLLIRSATLEGAPRLQGVWLDWPQLRARLLESVRDLLPGASLLPVSVTEARNDAEALATLPVRLLAGQVPPAQIREVSTLRPALAVAWGCLIAAAAAIAYVLHRAVLLSERRGAFVSAVTHELRTPLTTFRLYSEMLADDMVPDPDRRRGYLQTLCDESTRLMHLVENVLAYSRIEKGRTAGRMEDLQTNQLLDRVVPRLEQRLAQGGLELQVESGAGVPGSGLRADAMAVEQILLNLADNACKYAAPDSRPGKVELKVTSTSSEIAIEFRDYGPGLPECQKKRLFQPFSKSATEAAHSAPGVGLGLALSRQLAREQGGNLTHRQPAGRGAAFVLTLKRLPGSGVA